jgi:hypothetical protein
VGLFYPAEIVEVGDFLRVRSLQRRTHRAWSLTLSQCYAHTSLVCAEIFHRRLCTSRLVVNVAVRVNSGYARSMSREKRTRSVAVIGAYIIFYYIHPISSPKPPIPIAMPLCRNDRHFLPLGGKVIGEKN